ncbi:hypothetical protein [Prosthecobacter sp.]|uniref:hypothetical protein n=1 Tax=Prosthecobacter sp. TaxID=1965333 RepID=UPI0037846A0A
MNITGIEFYRDGGSIEFFIERGGIKERIWLETPFAGEPRALLIDSNKAIKGGEAAALLSADIERWWAGLGEEMRKSVLDEMSRKDFSSSPNAITEKAWELSRVRFVGDYIAKHYI